LHVQIFTVDIGTVKYMYVSVDGMVKPWLKIIQESRLSLDLPWLNDVN